MMARRRESRNLYVTNEESPRHRNPENSNISKILTLVRGFAIKLDDNSSLGSPRRRDGSHSSDDMYIYIHIDIIKRLYVYEAIYLIIYIW